MQGGLNGFKINVWTLQVNWRSHFIQTQLVVEKINVLGQILGKISQKVFSGVGATIKHNRVSKITHFSKIIILLFLHLSSKVVG